MSYWFNFDYARHKDNRRAFWEGMVLACLMGGVIFLLCVVLIGFGVVPSFEQQRQMEMARQDAPNWQCIKCNEIANPYRYDKDWRFTGTHWEHDHGYSSYHGRRIGWVPAERN